MVELKGEDEPEFEMILDLEFGKDEKFQSQPMRYIEVTQEKPQQLEEVGRKHARNRWRKGCTHWYKLHNN